jgi:hypothetical protein
MAGDLALRLGVDMELACCAAGDSQPSHPGHGVWEACSHHVPGEGSHVERFDRHRDCRAGMLGSAGR